MCVSACVQRRFGEGACAVTGIVNDSLGNAYFVLVFLSRFLLRNKMCSTVLGLRRFRRLLTTSPALEKTVTHGTEDAGVHR